MLSHNTDPRTQEAIQYQMNKSCDITTEEVMRANYRDLQLLAKRVGIRANTREYVLRRALLCVSVSEATLLQESGEPCPEENVQSSCPTGLSLNTILIAMVSLFCVLRFPNCFTVFYSNLVFLLACCGISASVLVMIFCCKCPEFSAHPLHAASARLDFC